MKPAESQTLWHGCNRKWHAERAPFFRSFAHISGMYILSNTAYYYQYKRGKTD